MKKYFSVSLISMGLSWIPLQSVAKDLEPATALDIANEIWINKKFHAPTSEFLGAARDVLASIEDQDNSTIASEIRKLEGIPGPSIDFDVLRNWILSRADLMARPEANDLGVEAKSLIANLGKHTGLLHEQRVFTAFEIAIKRQNMDTVRQIFQDFEKTFLRDELPSSVSNALLTYGHWAAIHDDKGLAGRIFKHLARSYPHAKISRDAVKAYAKDIAQSENDDEIWGSAEERRDFAQDILRRLGTMPKIRNFALQLAGVSQDIPNIPVDELSEQQKLKLLDTSEYLVGIREYEKAFKITEYLAQSKNFSASFKEEEILFLYAKTLNSIQEPAKAADAYRKVFVEFPKSKLARAAQTRHLLSLHYAKQFESAATVGQAFLKQNRFDPDTKWRTFWASYLAGYQNFPLIEKFGTEADARTSYWSARSRAKGAPNQFIKLSQSIATSAYGILARWRKPPGAALSPQGPAATADIKFESALDHAINPTVIDTNDIRYSRMIHLANSPFEAMTESMAPGLLAAEKDPVMASKIANASEQYFLASRLIQRSEPNLFQKELSETQLQQSIAAKPEKWRLHFPKAYAYLVEPIAKHVSIDPILVYSLMRAESTYRPSIQSNVGARGLLQIMPTTGFRLAEILKDDAFEPAQLSRPDVNIAYGATYIKRLLTYYGGNTVVAIAAYNAGPIAVDRWIKQNPDFQLDEFIENIPYNETRNYVSKVLHFMDIYTRLSNAKGIPLNLASKIGNSRKLPSPVAGMDMF